MKLIVVGSVQDVISGKVTEKSLHTVSMQDMCYGLGGGAKIVNGVLAIGEAIIYERSGYIYTHRNSWKDKDLMQTPFLMGIVSKPSQKIEIESVQSLEILYKDLLKEYPMGFVIIGKCHFSNLAVAYLKLSPIYGENINALREKYWESENYTNCLANLFGVVLPEPDPRMFYSNPNEATLSAFPSHTHALLQGGARHMLTHSSITSGEFWIEPIDEVCTK